MTKEIITKLRVESAFFAQQNHHGIEAFAKLPEDIRKEILDFMNIKHFDDLMEIYEVNDSGEEIWEPETYFTPTKSWPDVHTTGFCWGHIALGVIVVSGKVIKTFYEQNASPIAFWVIPGHAEYLSKFEIET